MDLKAQREAALKAARDIAERAKGEQRNLTDDETKCFDEHLAKADEFAAQIKAAQESTERFKRIAALGPADDGQKRGEEAAAKSLGEHFAKAAGEHGLKGLRFNAGTTITTTEFDGAKAATDPHVTTDYPPVLLTDVDRSVVREYRRPPVIADLLNTGTVSGNAVTYFVENPAVEGNFATVAEGAAKPQLHNLAPTQRTDAIKKIAAWWDMTDEMMEDLPFVVSEINNRGLYMLAMAEEAQLLSGDGTGSNVLGLLNRSGIQVQAAVAGAPQDGIFSAMTSVQTATGLVADGVVINPADYQKLRLSRDANGQYYGGGFFTGEYGNGGILTQPPLWGLRTIVTAAVPVGAALVGAFRAAATVYRKGGVRVEATNSDRDKFTRNMVTTRVEERIGLAVPIPQAIVKVGLTAA